MRYAICHYAELSSRKHDAPIPVTESVKNDWTFKARPNDEFDRVLGLCCCD